METHRAALSTPWCAYVSKASPTQSLSRVNQGTQPCLFSGRGLLSWAQSQLELSCAVSQVTLMRKGISIDRAASVPQRGPQLPSLQSRVTCGCGQNFLSIVSFPTVPPMDPGSRRHRCHLRGQGPKPRQWDCGQFQQRRDRWEV